MCNDYEQHIKYAEYCRMMEDDALQIPTHQTELDLPEADDIKIGDNGPVMRAVDERTVELAQMKFEFPPKGKGGPAFQFPLRGAKFCRQQQMSHSSECLFLSSSARSIQKRNIASQ